MSCVIPYGPNSGYTLQLGDMVSIDHQHFGLGMKTFTGLYLDFTWTSDIRLMCNGSNEIVYLRYDRVYNVSVHSKFSESIG